MKAAISAIALLSIAGCMSAPGVSVKPETSVELAQDGVRPAESDLRIDFGRAQAGTIAAVTKLQNNAPVSVQTNTECGAGPVTTARWANGLSLNFMDGAFLGWVAQAPYSGTSTVEGLTVGAEMAAFSAQPQQTSLGQEFRVDGIWALVSDGDTKVDTMWAGLTCFFR